MTSFIQFYLPLIMNVAKYFLFAGIPFLICYRLFPHVFSKSKIQSSIAVNKDFLREIRHSLLTTVILAAVVILILKTPLRDYTRLYTDLSTYGAWWIPFSLLLSLVLHDTYFYWMHRIVHSPALYRRVHLVHHKSVNPSPWASFSFHFLEAILEGMAAPIILFLIPMHPIALIMFGLLSFGINVYGHLGFEIAPKWLRRSFLFQWVTTSTHHNLHHSKFKGNYGLYFRVWDRLMGTENPEYVKEYDRIQERRFGAVNTSSTSLKTRLFVLFISFFSLATLSAAEPPTNIEGKWRFEDSGATVLIYKENGFYVGRLLDAGNDEDNQLLEGKGEIFILRDFKKVSDVKYCCGTTYAPKKKRTLSSTLVVVEEDKLRIDLKIGFLSGNRTLIRL